MLFASAARIPSTSSSFISSSSKYDEQSSQEAEFAHLLSEKDKEIERLKKAEEERASVLAKKGDFQERKCKTSDSWKEAL